MSSFQFIKERWGGGGDQESLMKGKGCLFAFHLGQVNLSAVINKIKEVQSLTLCLNYLSSLTLSCLSIKKNLTILKVISSLEYKFLKCFVSFYLRTIGEKTSPRNRGCLVSML
jgi:hypothetical protein